MSPRVQAADCVSSSRFTPSRASRSRRSTDSRSHSPNPCVAARRGSSANTGSASTSSARREAVARAFEPREQRVPVAGAHGVRVQQQHLRHGSAQQLITGLLVVAHAEPQGREVVLGDGGERGRVARPLRRHPRWLERPVLVVDRDRQVAQGVRREPGARRVDLGRGVALVQEREAEEAQAAAAPAEERVELCPAPLDVGESTTRRRSSSGRGAGPRGCRARARPSARSRAAPRPRRRARCPR